MMNAPTKHENRVDAPLADMPRLVPQSPSVASGPTTSAAAHPAVPEIVNSPAMAPGIGGPNLDLPPPPRLRPFAADVAIDELAGQLRVEQHLVAQPPMRGRRRKAMARWIDRSAFVVILSMVGVLCVGTLLAFVEVERKQAGDVVGKVMPLFDGASRADKPAHSARLAIESRKGVINEPLALGVSLNHASGGETVTLAGLPVGTTLSVGTPLGLSGWQVPARDLGHALVRAPENFVGVMDAAIDLHSAGDWLLDSRVIRLEWIAKSSAPVTSKLDAPKPPRGLPDSGSR